MRSVISILLLLLCFNIHAQPSNKLVMKGNEAYRNSDFIAAIDLYKKALKLDFKNNIARFNLANALQRQNETEQSKKLYTDIINTQNDNALKIKSFYNNGLVLIKEKKMQEAALSFMQAIKLDPSDNDSRENLQFVLNEMKKQNPSKQKSNEKNNQKNLPTSTKNFIEQKLNELRNQEKQLQKRLQKQYGHGNPEKDW